MPPTDDNSLILLASSISPAVAASSSRRRTTRHAVGGRRLQLQRRRAAFPLSMECLEPRYLLSGLVGLPDPSVADEAWETPAVVLDSECTTIEVANASPDRTDDAKSEGGDDATDELACKPDGDVGDQPAVAENIDDVNLDFADSSFVQRHSSNDADFYELAMESALVADESIGEVSASPDTEQQVGLVIPQPAAGTASVSTPRPTNTATANVGSEHVSPSAPSQTPVYFSGATTLSRARWIASAEKLADADTLLERVEVDAKDRSVPPDTIAVISQARAIPVERAATLERFSNADPDVSERTGLEVAFSQVHSWTEIAGLSPPRIAAAHELPSRQLADQLVAISLTIAPNADKLLDAVAPVEGEEPAAKEAATANIALPFGGVQGWYLLGGIGVWQVVLSVRVRHRKQSGENLA